MYRLPSKRANLIRSYEGSLFFSQRKPKEERIYIFYLLLRPTFKWLKKELVSLNLEPDEAESELYLLCARLFNSFDKTKSSIIPYLNRAIPWKSSHLIQSKKPTKEIPYGLLKPKEEIYHINEEYYFSIPGILTENRYIGKCFTKDEKYIISIILMSDADELTQKKIGEQLNLSSRTVRQYIKNIKEVINGG